MLKTLYIKNYVIIKELKIDFNNCFSVLTGETGAGKSILIGALNLIIGKRADVNVLMDKHNKCVIEAVFDISAYNMKHLFEKHDLDYEENTIIRREINKNGKSRAFINDTPVNLALIKDINSKLIDINSQHESLELNTDKYRYKLIDSFAGTLSLSKEYESKYNEYVQLTKEINNLENQIKTTKAEYDYCKFQIEQIDKLNLKDANELKELETEAVGLDNAEEIKAKLLETAFLISDNENSILECLKSAKRAVESIENVYKNSDNITKRIESVIIELRDVYDQLHSDNNNTENNPQLLDKINNRIDEINTQLKKHSCLNIEELLSVYKDFKSKMSGAEHMELELEKKKKLYAEFKTNLIKTAKNLSAKRQESFTDIEKDIVLRLQELGMKHSKFSILNNMSSELGLRGFDNINFLFSANKNVELKELNKVASGGELSRLMLTIKSLLVKGLELSTIIFDEIDTGVSGEIADKMANIMQEIAKDRQVICITHLPQVAAKGNVHYKVVKDEAGENTETHVVKLNNNQRINELASMMSGAKTTPQAIENAKILLS